MDNEVFCGNCGTPMQPDAKFCPSCGAPAEYSPYFSPQASDSGYIPPTEKIEEPVNAYPYTSSTPYSSQYPQKPAKNNRSIFVIIGVIATIACCALIAIFWLGSKILGDNPPSKLASKPTATFEEFAITETPTLTGSSPTEPTLSGNQQLNEFSFFDDFSSNALGWQEESDENSAVGIDNGAYFIHIKAADYGHHVFTPVEPLTNLDFYAQVASGAANGLFGVNCFWKDISNHHYVYVDRYKNRIWVGYIADSEWFDIGDAIPITKTSGMQKFGVSCTPGAITVFVDEQQVADIPLDQPQQISNMLLAVVSYSNTSADGIKVLFDEASGYEAQQ